MFRGNPKSDNVTRSIRLDHTHDEGDHFVSVGNYLVTNGLCVGEKVPDRFAVVCLTVCEASLIESPTFVKIRVAHRCHNKLTGRSHHRLNRIPLFSTPRPHRIYLALLYVNESNHAAIDFRYQDKTGTKQAKGGTLREGNALLLWLRS